jgi:hypothetical protein
MERGVVKIAVSRVRSRPVYLQRGGETVTLVFERRQVEVTRQKGEKAASVLLRPALPRHVYVIDSEGVRRVSGRKIVPAVACLVVAALALLWAWRS